MESRDQEVVFEAPWLCIHAHPKHEHIAAANLRKMLSIEVWNPRVSFTRNTRRGLAAVTESLFPGYFFARFDLNSELDSVRYTPGVANVVHFGSRYPTISPVTIAHLQTCFAEGDVAVLEEQPLPGQKATITHGSFCGIEVIVLRALPGRRRVQVLLDMLGTTTTTELDLQSLSVQRRYPRSLSVALPAAA